MILFNYQDAKKLDLFQKQSLIPDKTLKIFCNYFNKRFYPETLSLWTFNELPSRIDIAIELFFRDASKEGIQFPVIFESSPVNKSFLRYK